MKICCGFGHRDVFENITDKLNKTVEEAVRQGCEIFLTGAMGKFDSLFSSAVRMAKQKHPDIKLICVKPYFTNELNSNKKYYDLQYDDVFIPQEVMGVHYKAAIKTRNHFMIDKSDFIVFYVTRKFGGAYEALNYANSKNKTIIRL